jgi:hypothetical protein
MSMRTEDPRIILRRDGDDELVVDHPGQPADYVHPDGSVWTWRERWRVTGGERRGAGTVGGVHLRVYDPAEPGAGTA